MLIYMQLQQNLTGGNKNGIAQFDHIFKNR